MANKSLVIVESPAKAKTINKYLGADFKVAASVGHIIDLPKNKFGVNIEDGFKPQYINIRGKEKIIKELRALAKGADNIYIATDPDREGEAIAYHISSVLNTAKKEIHRVEFHEITRSGVESAMSHPRSIDMKMVNSQQARRVLDRIVGYKISPVLWRMIYRGLSAGRVQSVALYIICEREVEIREFKSEEFWTIKIVVKTDTSDPFELKLVKINNKKAHIPDQESADNHVEAINNAALKITSIKKRALKRHPQPPFTTSTMQQSGSRMLHMSTKRIMSIAQTLYEGVDVPGHGRIGLITYMRTDSTRISAEALNASRDYIKEQFGDDYLSPSPRIYKTKKSAQDAHESIRPANISNEFSPENLKAVLSAYQFRLYNLIWKRFVACQMMPAIYEKTTISVTGDQYLFTTEGEVMKFPGYEKVYRETAGDDEENGTKIIPPDLNEGDMCTLQKILPEQNFTKPPARYTESTLVKEMDRLGIGRPSTYAQIVSTILHRKYVELKERKLFATELGETVNKILIENFPDIFNVDFTASMEKKLDEIAGDHATYEDVMNEFYTPFDRAIKAVEENKEEIKSDLLEVSGETCDKCGRPMIIRWGRNGRFMACSGFPECKNTKPLEEEEPEETDEVCEKCNSPMVVKMGRYGKFLACSNYPDCKNTKPITVNTGVSCPKNSCEGTIIERRSKRGKIFYGCTNYPKCDFVSWDKPVNQKCPSCGNKYMSEKSSKSKGQFLRCPECKFEIIEENVAN